MCVNFPKACGPRAHAWLRFCLALSRRSEGLDIAEALLSRRSEGPDIAKALYNA